MQEDSPVSTQNLKGMLIGLGLVGAVISVVCMILILIDAFQDELWKGLVALLCGVYMLYYAFAEFEHEHKWLIVLGWIGGSLMSYFTVGGFISL